MKTRIISAVIALCLFIGILSLRNVAPAVLIISFCALCVIALYELLHETKLVKNKILTAGCFIYSVVTMLIYANVINGIPNIYIKILLALFLLIVSLATHSKTTPQETAVSYAFTVFLTFAFSGLLMLINYHDGHGLLYLILACCFAWGCDTGAYFVGVFLGKHKLVPVISPKKTVEGAIGGIVICTVLSVVIGLIYNVNSSVYMLNIVKLAVITPFFAVFGMIGDLLASYIKRSCGIKDYGKIMPGHGGVLDRFDSLLFIAPLFCVLLGIMPLFK